MIETCLHVGEDKTCQMVHTIVQVPASSHIAPVNTVDVVNQNLAAPMCMFVMPGLLWRDAQAVKQKLARKVWECDAIHS